MNLRLNGVIDDFMPSLGLVNFRRGLFFPAGEQSKPQFVWIKTWIAYPGYETWDKEEFFGKGGADRIFGAHNNIQARDAARDSEDTLSFYCKEDATEESPKSGGARFHTCIDLLPLFERPYRSHARVRRFGRKQPHPRS